MKFNNIPNKSYNTEDGIIWASRSVAVNGLIFIKYDIVEDIYVLLSKRSKSMMDEGGKWCLPCGYLDFSETIEEATNREIFEETGFNVYEYEKYISINMPNYFIDDNIKSNRQNISFTHLRVYDDIPQFPILLDKTDESDENKWISISTLSSFDIAFNHREIIINAVNFLKYKNHVYHIKL